MIYNYEGFIRDLRILMSWLDTLSQEEFEARFKEILEDYEIKTIV